MDKGRFAELKLQWRLSCGNERNKLAAEIGKLFTSRREWKNGHRGSYLHHIKHGGRKNGLDPFKDQSRIAKIAKWRDELHFRMRPVPGGMAIEIDVGHELRYHASLGKPADLCIQAAELKLSAILGGRR